MTAVKIKSKHGFKVHVHRDNIMVVRYPIIKLTPKTIFYQDHSTIKRESRTHETVLGTKNCWYPTLRSAQQHALTLTDALIKAHERAINDLRHCEQELMQNRCRLCEPVPNVVAGKLRL